MRSSNAQLHRCTDISGILIEERGGGKVVKARLRSAVCRAHLFAIALACHSRARWRSDNIEYILLRPRSQHFEFISLEEFTENSRECHGILREERSVFEFPLGKFTISLKDGSESHPIDQCDRGLFD